MKRLTGAILCVAAVMATTLAAAQPQATQAQNDDALFVWYTSEKCQTRLETGAPGSSPDLAIPFEQFDEPFHSAAANEGERESEEPRQSPHHCKWVRLTGFFLWMDYYHYRGELVENAWTSSDVRYIVENFADPSTRRSDLARRKVTVVGRFYNICEAADRAQKASGETWIMLLGPCHYGFNNGMALSDVMIQSVNDDAPRYILGERNRRFFNQLLPVEDDQRSLLISRTRAWAASVKRGPQAFAAELLASDPSLSSEHEDERQRIRRDLESPDSYVSYLSDLDSFRRFNVDRAEAAVFWDQTVSADDPSDREAVGCVCLSRRCGDEWPILEADAANFLGRAACTRLTRSRKDPTWRW